MKSIGEMETKSFLTEMSPITTGMVTAVITVDTMAIESVITHLMADIIHTIHRGIDIGKTQQKRQQSTSLALF